MDFLHSVIALLDRVQRYKQRMPQGTMWARRWELILVSGGCDTSKPRRKEKPNELISLHETPDTQSRKKHAHLNWAPRIVADRGPHAGMWREPGRGIHRGDPIAPSPRGSPSCGPAATGFQRADQLEDRAPHIGSPDEQVGSQPLLRFFSRHRQGARNSLVQRPLLAFCRIGGR